ncbi:MAG: lysophospholipid acyltransferase family protein [Deltaproteobacteria bacterium]|nr:lysophospholipid acyltransferase family protein [Deltaproteobacteria bacterium]
MGWLRLLGRAILAFLLAWVVRILGATLRLRFVRREVWDAARATGRPLIFAFHHGRQFMLLRHKAGAPVALMASLSKDGDLQAGILTRLGYRVARGSSSRGGARGLVSLIRELRAGAYAGMAVDGPRGPFGVVKPGVVALAQTTNALIVPVAASVRRAKVFGRAWDRYMLPAPFTSGEIVFGDAIDVSRTAADGAEVTRKEIERSLASLIAEVDARVRRA